MFNSITGEITYKDQDKVFLRSGDVEWELSISAKASGRLPPEGERVRLLVHLHHREDQMKLFGFWSPLERALFLDLLKVEGMGPRLAMKVLSGIEAEDLAAALESEDVGAISGLPGLGQKTAQKVLLKLKGKVSFAREKKLGVEEDIINALAGMGFDRRVAREAVAASLKELNGEEKGGLGREELERELFRRALKQISKER
jgi:Holliday junction DNA helicase RuvA